MKSIMTVAPKQEQTYPCLMEGSNGVVVLFTAPRVGTLVGIGTGSGYTQSDLGVHRIATNGSGWGMSYFKPFIGTITLSNE